MDYIRGWLSLVFFCFLSWHIYNWTIHGRGRWADMFLQMLPLLLGIWTNGCAVQKRLNWSRCRLEHRCIFLDFFLFTARFLNVFNVFLFYFFMDTLSSRCGHYIFVLWFLLLLLSFLPRLIPAVADWTSIPYFHTRCGFSANLECRSEMWCTRLAENTGRKMSPKNRRLRTIAQLCPAIYSQLRHVSTIGKTC